MLKIFLGLIKSHHDGIAITETNEIVFHNQQMLKIFGINEFQEVFSNYEEGSAEMESCEEAMKKELLKCLQQA